MTIGYVNDIATCISIGTYLKLYILTLIIVMLLLNSRLPLILLTNIVNAKVCVCMLPLSAVTAEEILMKFGYLVYYSYIRFWNRT